MKAPDESRLERRALFYLQRYAASRAHLAQLLRRRALLEARAHGIPEGVVEARITRLLDRLEALGLIDDRSYAELKARRWLARGLAPQRAYLRLLEKGVAEEVARAVIEELEAEGEGEFAALVAYARRRRLGPFRSARDRERYRERDLAVLARAGFRYATVRRLFEASGEEVPEAGSSRKR